MNRTAFDPALIRQVLNDVAATNRHAAAKKHGLAHRNVYRWTEWREQSGGTWPTDEDITNWHTAEANRDITSRPVYRRYKRRRYQAEGTLQIPSVGTQRRLQALARLGHTGTDIGNQLGLSPARTSQLMRGNRSGKYVLTETAQRVAVVYERMSMVVPVGWVADRQRRAAESRGWPPPLAWDNIDDPDERPATGRATPRRTDIDPAVVLRVINGDRLPMTPAERVAVVNQMRAAGWSLVRIEQHTGITKPERLTTEDVA